MSETWAFTQAFPLISVETNSTPAAKDTGGWKAQNPPPLFNSIIHLVPWYIKALDGPNKRSHDIYLGIIDRKCAPKCGTCVCFTLIMKTTYHLRATSLKEKSHDIKFFFQPCPNYLWCTKIASTYSTITPNEDKCLQKNTMKLHEAACLHVLLCTNQQYLNKY